MRGRSQKYLPKVVRIGAKGQMRADVWEAVGLDRMVEKRVAKEEAEDARARKEGQQGMQQLEAEVDSLTEKMSRGGGEAHADLVARRRVAMKELSTLKGKEGQDKARRQERMRRLRSQVRPPSILRLTAMILQSRLRDACALLAMATCAVLLAMVR